MVEYTSYWRKIYKDYLNKNDRSGLELSSFLSCVLEDKYNQSITYEGLKNKSVIILEEKL